MRFSAIFQLPLPLPAQADSVRTEPAALLIPAVPAAAAAEDASRWPLDLPDDLDARVRLVGEWQLGEG